MLPHPPKRRTMGHRLMCSKWAQPQQASQQKGMSAGGTNQPLSSFEPNGKEWATGQKEEWKSGQKGNLLRKAAKKKNVAESCKKKNCKKKM